MRVLIITGAYPPVKCGVGDYAYHLANALSELPGVEVAILTSSSAAKPEELSKVTVLRGLPDWRIRNLRRLRKLIREFNPDVVHIQYPTQGYNGWLSRIVPILGRLMGLPVVQTWHEHFSHCRAISWLNLLGCDALIFVRPDLPAKLPGWVKHILRSTLMRYVPNASTIPNVILSNEAKESVRWNLSAGKPMVCFFGFAYPNKGVDLLFEIANPLIHHLVLLCDLSEKNSYQANILKLLNSPPWAGNVTVTGFQPATGVAEILAVADAVIFPFPDGAGEWNTSLKAAERAGVFTIATTKTRELLGYNEKDNIYFAACDDISEMRIALETYVGRRIEPKFDNQWARIATDHQLVYQSLCKVA